MNTSEIKAKENTNGDNAEQNTVNAINSNTAVKVANSTLNIILKNVPLVCLILSIIFTIAGGFPLACVVFSILDSKMDIGTTTIVFAILSLIPLIISGALKTIFSTFKGIIYWSYLLIPIFPIDLAMAFVLGFAFLIISFAFPFIYILPVVFTDYFQKIKMKMDAKRTENN